MGAHTFYCNKKNKDVGEWYNSLDSGLRSEIVVSLLRAYMENNSAGEKVVSSVEEQHNSLVENMRAVVDRMFSDITNETVWIRDARNTNMVVSVVVRNRLDDVRRKCPANIHDEAMAYFKECYPKLAKEAGL